MKLETLGESHFEKLIREKTPLIDVRAPVEFALGSIPNAINIPILDDEQRALVGTEYKVNGSEAALRLGHELVSGDLKKQRLNAWSEFVGSNPSSILFCFRGGKRSQISQEWLAEAGVNLARIEGGYKKFRNYLMQAIEDFSVAQNFLPVAGPTGSGKTILINELRGLYPAIDLEGLANHRGSAFGSMNSPQPTQINFENNLGAELIILKHRWGNKATPLFEDESRLIGKSVLPKLFFEKLNASPIILVEEELRVRVQNIFKDYILDSAIAGEDSGKAQSVFARYRKSLLAISKKLGGERTTEVLGLLNFSESQFLQNKSLESNRAWIEKLLIYYYDPLYLASLERRKLQIVFKGKRKDCFDYLKNQIK